MKATSKRRRTKAKIEEERKYEESKKLEIEKKLERFHQYEAEISNLESHLNEKENYRKLCEHMFEEGVMKQNPDGSFQAVEDPMERESIKSKSKSRIQTPATPSAHKNEFDQQILNEDPDKMEEMA